MTGPAPRVNNREWQQRNETREPKLDFSVFHPLDHRPGSRTCRRWAGGTAHHLRLAWRYRWRDRARGATFCRVGLHEWVPTWRGNPNAWVGYVCASCWRDRPGDHPEPVDQRPPSFRRDENRGPHL